MQLESRTLSQMNQLVFKCIKCATIFCQESNRNILSKYSQLKKMYFILYSFYHSLNVPTYYIIYTMYIILTSLHLISSCTDGYHNISNNSKIISILNIKYDFDIV